MTISLTRRQWLLVFLLSFFWTTFLIFFGSSAATLQYKWKDHVSNIGVTKLFFSSGAKVFYVPKQDLTAGPWPDRVEVPAQFKDVLPDESFFVKDQKPLFLVWPDLPNPYSPGVYFFCYPLAFMAYDLNWGFFPACVAFAFALLLIAHWTFFTLKNFLTPAILEATTRWKKFGYYLILFLTYCELCRWPMNGQYETVALPFLILAIITGSEKEFPKALALLGGALFFHPRALFYLPLAFYWIFCWVKKKRCTLRDFIYLFLAFLGASSLAVALYFSLKVHNDPAVFRGLNKWSFKSLLDLRDWGRGALLFSIISVVGAFQFRYRYFHLLFLFLWTHVLLLQSAQTRGWYVTLLIPFFFLEKPSWRAMFFAGLSYFAVAQFYPNNSPLEFTFVKSVIHSFSDRGLVND